MRHAAFIHAFPPHRSTASRQGEESMNDGWIGVDLDGTLAAYTKFTGETQIGEPIPLMVKRVKAWLKTGKEVRIFTARVAHPDDMEAVTNAIHHWCVLHLGKQLRVTCKKDHKMIELWDDRCVQVIPNTGRRVDGKEE
jgi:hypothetical protein